MTIPLATLVTYKDWRNRQNISKLKFKQLMGFNLEKEQSQQADSQQKLKRQETSEDKIAQDRANQKALKLLGEKIGIAELNEQDILNFKNKTIEL